MVNDRRSFEKHERQINTEKNGRNVILEFVLNKIL